MTMLPAPVRRYWTRRAETRAFQATARADQAAILTTLTPLDQNPLSLVGISEATGIDLPHTQDAVTALLLAGYLALDIAPRPDYDRRPGGSVRYYLTPAGILEQARRCGR